MTKIITETSTALVCDRWSTQRIIKEASKYKSVLDVGCGSGRVIKAIKSRDRYGVDVCTKALEAAKEDNNGVTFRELDLTRVIHGTDSLPEVECVIGLDIIEHFTKEDAVLLLVHLEGLVSKCLMWFIPVGHHPQFKDDRGFGNDYYQTHRSTWQPEDMERLGYDVWFYPNWHKNNKPPKQKGAMWCRKILE
jgi:SAM-dependent methyltransferase